MHQQHSSFFGQGSSMRWQVRWYGLVFASCRAEEKVLRKGWPTEGAGCDANRIILNTKNYWKLKKKRDSAWGCAWGINTTWENLQIEKHKSIQWAERTPSWFVLFDLQIFSGGVYSPRATSRTISFSISNSFRYYFVPHAPWCHAYILIGESRARLCIASNQALPALDTSHATCCYWRRLLGKLRQDPLDLSFWSFFTFLHHGIEEVERHLLWKFYKKIRRKSWSNVSPKLVACIGFLYKVVHKIGRLRKFNRSRGI